MQNSYNSVRPHSSLNYLSPAPIIIPDLTASYTWQQQWSSVSLGPIDNSGRFTSRQFFIFLRLAECIDDFQKSALLSTTISTADKIPVYAL
ncbi:hypothetical protein ACRBEV_05845 [Methylobacterium phyllosphaerae]